ncbi:uncharacterized protein BJ171DRAFT_597497 [Polychytrium aggregatum]|uniref:uncharacterized protein n=1 Tax=Polychytrium aggregatum TaxID=110093 RepID=UPI0022FF3207|nr:uncharacterized protein BJ171DRAFT_597497 [Polychytrium aggregatum]KAI9206330.1 hypothetical protein BJ171DRAFT_597497 [Polychytrium aggregatum]
MVKPPTKKTNLSAEKDDAVPNMREAAKPPADNRAKLTKRRSTQNRRPSTVREEKEASRAGYVSIDPNLVIATGMSPAELQELIEIFWLVDLDHGGTIDMDELETLMTTLGLRVSKIRAARVAHVADADPSTNERTTLVQNEIEALMSEIDSGEEIDFESFVKAMSRKVQLSMKDDSLMRAFRVFAPLDRANNRGREVHEGMISVKTTIDILTDFGDENKRLTREEAEDLVMQVVHDIQSGFYDYKALIQMYTEKPIQAGVAGAGPGQGIPTTATTPPT